MALEMQTFDAGPDAFALAKRMAKFGHKDWIVWRLADGSYKAAKMSRESLEMAMREATGSETKPGYFSCIHRDTAQGENVAPYLAQIWLANMIAGHYQF
jgi:hypothetical protein